MLWQVDLRTTPERPDGEGSVIAGVAGSPARRTGTVRVIATGDATRRLRDGDPVTVDGTAGEVRPGGRQVELRAHRTIRGQVHSPWNS